MAAPLLRWSRDDSWTLRDAYEGTLSLGATGSGKTTGSGRAIAHAFLRAGFGGLVLTAKSDERATWEKYCRETARSQDLVIFSLDTALGFNFLDHERTRKGSGAGLTENIVNLFSTVLEVADRGSSGDGGGRDREPYWRNAQRQLTRNAVDLLSLAGETISVPHLYRLVVSAPVSAEQMRSDEWRAKSFCFQCLGKADKRERTQREQADFELVADFFVLEYPNLSEKTRSVIVSTLTSMVDVLNRGVLRDLFCGETNITPEAIEGGKIVLVDLPVKEFAEIGVFANVLWKHAFQRSIERRNVEASPRPVFMWADEAQHFATSYDMQFQTTCRSARVATVLLTQNVSNFHAALGGSEKGRAETASLFANLNTKILHANSDPVTNEWAATQIGRTKQLFASGNSTQSADDRSMGAFGLDLFGRGGSTSAGFSESYEYDLQPAAFSQLRTGGPGNAWKVDAILFQNGRVFSGSGKSWLPVTFDQRK